MSTLGLIFYTPEQSKGQGPSVNTKRLAEKTAGQLQEAGLDTVKLCASPYLGAFKELLKGADEGVLCLSRPLPIAAPEALAYLIDYDQKGFLLRGARQKGRWAPFFWLEGEALKMIQRGQARLGDLISRMPIQEVESWDPGLFLSPNDPSQLAFAKRLEADRKAYGPVFVRHVHDFAELPIHIRAHCDAVADVATRLASALKDRGHPIDVDLVRGSSALHDICRLMPNHEAAGADLLRRMGYPDLARVVARHMEVEQEDILALNETALVFYADKITEETCRVTPYDRYARALDRFPPSTKTGSHIMKNLQAAWQIEEDLRVRLQSDFDRALILS